MNATLPSSRIPSTPSSCVTVLLRMPNLVTPWRQGVEGWPVAVSNAEVVVEQRDPVIVCRRHLLEREGYEAGATSGSHGGRLAGHHLTSGTLPGQPHLGRGSWMDEGIAMPPSAIQRARPGESMHAGLMRFSAPSSSRGNDVPECSRRTSFSVGTGWELVGQPRTECRRPDHDDGVSTASIPTSSTTLTPC